MEVQDLVCSCGATCSGSFVLTFRGQTTVDIAHDATAAVVQSAIDVRYCVNTETHRHIGYHRHRDTHAQSYTYTHMHSHTHRHGHSDV